MDERKFELIDFKVTELSAHVNTEAGGEMELHAESRMGARTPDPADGTVYIFLNIKISDGEAGNFLLDVTTTSVIQLPEGMLDVGFPAGLVELSGSQMAVRVNNHGVRDCGGTDEVCGYLPALKSANAEHA